MTTEQPIDIHKSAHKLQTKIDLLCWIGMIPEPQDFMHQLQIREFRQALVNDATPDDEMKHILEMIPEGHRCMNDGLTVIQEKLETEECIECGKCDDLKEVITMLMDDTKDIDEVDSFIKEKLGDIEATNEVGLPGHRRPKEGVGAGNLRLVPADMADELDDDLISTLKQLASEDDEIDIESIGGGQGGVIKISGQGGAEKVKNILSHIFGGITGSKPDKDKLH